MLCLISLQLLSMINTILPLACLLTQVCASGYAEVPIFKKSPNSLAGDDVIKRANDDYVSEEVGAKGNYLATLKIGSDEQEVTALIDTGSSDLVVFRKTNIRSDGFNTSSSTTVRDLNQTVSASYIGDSRKGEFYKDTVKWGDAEIDLKFGVTNSSTDSGHGILGLSYESIESGGEYPNYPVALKDQGYTESVSYAISLDANTGNGSIVFGALDSSRYTGTLKEMRLEHNGSARVNFTVAGHSTDGALDSGTPYTILPEEIRADIAKEVNANWDDDRENYIRYGNVNGTSMNFTFDGLNITMKHDTLWKPIVHGGPGWVLNIRTEGDTCILGDTFMSNAYVVYDLERERIAIAQSNHNPGTPNYQIINGSIPGAVFDE